MFAQPLLGFMTSYNLFTLSALLTVLFGLGFLNFLFIYLGIGVRNENIYFLVLF